MSTKAEHAEATYRAIERAAEHLPQGWEIRIHVGPGYATAELTNPDGDEVLLQCGSAGLADEINDAIDAAIEEATAVIALAEPNH